MSVTTPTMMPAPAQVAATLSTPSEPPASAFIDPERRSRARRLPSPEHVVRDERGVAPQEAGDADTTVAQNTDSTGREAPQHEDDDRDQRQEVEPVLLRQAHARLDLLEGDLASCRTCARRSRPSGTARSSRGRSGSSPSVITSRYEILRNSAMRKAAAPSTGGEMIAPSPPAASRPPAASLP